MIIQITIIPLFLKKVLTFRKTHETYFVPLALGDWTRVLWLWLGQSEPYIKFFVCLSSPLETRPLLSRNNFCQARWERLWLTKWKKPTKRMKLIRKWKRETKSLLEASKFRILAVPASHKQNGPSKKSMRCLSVFSNNFLFALQINVPSKTQVTNHMVK